MRNRSGSDRRRQSAAFGAGDVIANIIALGAFALFTWVAIIMTWAVGTGPGLLPMPFQEGLITLTVLYAVGLILLLAAERWFITTGLIALLAMWGLFKGGWHYLMYTSIQDYNPDTTRMPAAGELALSVGGCAILLLTASGFLLVDLSSRKGKRLSKATTLDGAEPEIRGDS